MNNLNLHPQFLYEPKLVVVGVGSSGCGIVYRMSKQLTIKDIKFVAIDTNILSLGNPNAVNIQIGEKITHGLGAGSVPDIGKQAAESNRKEIEDALKGADLIFIAAGMGCGTGTGAAPVVAEIARKLGILTIGSVTLPFLFEGRMKMKNAIAGIAELQKYADTLITVENNKLLQIANKSTTIVDSFKMSDAVLCNAIEGISQIINQHSEINLDFADVKTIMKDMGRAIIGIGSSDDEADPMTLAVKAALDSPLLSGIDISGAKGLVVHYTCSKNISLMDLEKGQTIIDDAIGDNEANIMFGLAIDKDIENGVKAMIIVTGFE